MSQDFLYGFYYMQWAFRDSAGYPMGTQTDPDNVADGTTTHSYLLKNPIEYTPPEPSFARAIDRGGQKIRAQKDMGVTDFGEGSFSLSELDDTLWAYWTGASVDAATVTGWRMLGMNVNQVTVPAGFIIISSKAYDYANAADVWNHWVYPNAQVRITPPGASQSDGENPNAWNLKLIPNTSTRTLTGDLFSATAMSVTDNTDIGYRIQSGKPLGVTTYTEAGTPAGTFIAGYRPATSETDTTDKRLTKNGATASITTLSATTGVATFTAGSAGDKFVLVYETDYTAI